MAKTGEKSDLPALDLPPLDLPSLDIFGDQPLQSNQQPTAWTLRRQARESFKRGLKRETLAELITEPPPPGTALHIVSNGRWDYFCFIPLILGWIGTADELTGSTWTMSRANALDLLKFYDEGKVKKLTVVTGNYFLRRESAVAATLIEGLKARGQRFKSWENHTKVILLSNAAQGAFWVVEGSANWTANPRTEQNIIVNSRELFEFHKGWIEEMFSQ